MQSVTSRIWTRVTVSISYDDNHYTTWFLNLLASNNSIWVKISPVSWDSLVRCKHERKCSRACRADVSFRDVTTETPDRKNRAREWEWRHATEACAEDLGDLRKVRKLSFSIGRRRLTFGARRGLAAGSARDAVQMEKSAEKDWISLLMSKNLLTQR